jgi:hypothetical protein
MNFEFLKFQLTKYLALLFTFTLLVCSSMLHSDTMATSGPLLHAILLEALDHQRNMALLWPSAPRYPR